MATIQEMLTQSTTLVGTFQSEVVRADRHELVYVAITKGSPIGTVDGMFTAKDLRAIADFMENKK